MFKDFILKLILFVLAVILTAIISPIGFIYAIIIRVGKMKFSGIIEYIGNILLSLAVDIDRTGNYLNGDLFNATFQKDGHKFGDINETVSSALGKNQRDKKLTGVGFLLVAILNLIDKNHSLDAIQHDSRTDR